MTPEIEAKLQSFGIGLVTESPAVSIFARENCIAMVGRGPTGSLSLGSTGILTDQGLAYLIWREGEARLAAKGSEMAATQEQVEAIRQFSEDLGLALQLTQDSGPSTQD